MHNVRLKWFIEKILEKELDLGSFDEKLIIQKTVYLAQKMGMIFNYDFGWYVRGVYSSQLTVDMYDAHDTNSYYCPSEEDMLIVTHILSIKNILGNTSQTFDLISSIAYAKLKRGMDEERTKKFIKSVMPWFSDDDIDKTIEVTKQFNWKET